MKTLVLGLGNDLLADDAVGIIVARELDPLVSHLANVTVLESSIQGVALLDLFLGYDRALIVDAMVSGKHPPGTILELRPADLRPTGSPSPHFSGLPELFALAEKLDLHFPREVRIFAVEVRDALTIGGEMSEEVKKAVPEVVRIVSEVLAG